MSSEEQPPAQPAGSREHSQQQARLSMAKMGTHSAEQTIQHHTGKKKAYVQLERGAHPQRMHTQQSQDSFLPYEENRRKKHDGAAGAPGGLSHPSSGKSNSSAIAASQKVAGGALPRSGAPANLGAVLGNHYPPQASGATEGQGGLVSQGSVANGLQYSQNYQQQ